MKNKFFLLSTIISSSLLTIACNQSTAVEMHPNMPTQYPAKRPCYPASKCTGDPNLIGGGKRGFNQYGNPGQNYPGQGQYGYQDNQGYGYQDNQGYGYQDNQGYGYQDNQGYGYQGGQNYGYGYQPDGRGMQQGNGMQQNQSMYGSQLPQQGLQTQSTEKFVGTIRSVKKVNLPNHTQIQWILSTDQGDLLVIVGPAQFIDQARIKFKSGDRVTVTGYKVQANGEAVITAANVQKDGNTLDLLNQQRRPMWGSQYERSTYGMQRYGRGQNYGYGSQNYGYGGQNYGYQNFRS
jgi:hypothetical protein